MKQCIQSSIFIILIMFIFLPSLSLPAQDFGLIFEQSLDLNARSPQFNNVQFIYSGIFMPRFSTLLGDNGEIVVSVGLNYGYDPRNSPRWAFIPELLRTDFTMRFDMAELKVGRIPYRDPLGIIAEGLFDGASFSYDTKAGTFSIGGWYTGFLYKNRVAIAMTDDEIQYGNPELDYNNFAGTYFAPRRVLASLGWVHPSLGGRVNVLAAIIGQFDLTDVALHSQYLVARLIMPIGSFVVDFGGCFELLETSGDFDMAFAAGLGLTWMLPTRLEKHIALKGWFSSGVAGDSIAAFQPLTNMPQGNLLQAKLSGLSIISLDFFGRLAHTISLNLTASHFVRSDLGTYTSYPVTGVEGGGYFMGTEFFGNLLWGPSSDFFINLGAGVFLPFLGNAAPRADMLWKAELNVTISLY
jgi:hypothetical protein